MVLCLRRRIIPQTGSKAISPGLRMKGDRLGFALALSQVFAQSHLIALDAADLEHEMECWAPACEHRAISAFALPMGCPDTVTAVDNV
ncbi:hypothetical protein EG329_000100 [Mollisiaceae sp. DMI_Dod_QoI]|nr:hypothetical protein EG329_000100 [Helotiales sp. DMI_Dod_QoI]